MTTTNDATPNDLPIMDIRIEQALIEHVSQTGRAPAGITLGIQEWFRLCRERNVGPEDRVYMKLEVTNRHFQIPIHPSREESLIRFDDEQPLKPVRQKWQAE